MNSRTKILSTALVGAVLTAGVGVGVAVADPQAPSPGSSASPSHKADKTGKGTQTKRKALQARALHGEAILGGKKQQRVVTFQRGTVEKITATAITVKSVDGFTATYVMDGKTNVRKSKEKAKITDVDTQDHVRIRGIKDGNATRAKVIHERRNR